MAEELVVMVECPIKVPGCIGLVSSPGILEIKEIETGYLARTESGHVVRGNCGNYEQCMLWLIKQTRNLRRSAETRPYQERKE